MKKQLKRTCYAVLLFTTTLVSVAMAESFSDQLRTDALQELSQRYPEEGPFTRARERSMQVGDIMSYTYESTGSNGKGNRFVRYKVRLGNTDNAGKTRGVVLDKKICENHREDSCDQ